MKFPTLRDLVRFGIPATNKPAQASSAADKKAAAQARRQAVYDLRARKCAAELQRVAQLMTPSEFARYGKRLDMAAKTALRMKSSSKDLKLDLADLLPAEISQRAGLPADAAPVAPKNWERRAYPTGLVRDDQPATDGKLVITAQMIIDAAAKARGDVPPEKQIDPRQRWQRR